MTLTGIDQTNDIRRDRILDGAIKVFLAYGFSRTTMDDIARAAEMSRPALYLAFKNKTEIYRAIGAMMLGNSVERARLALEAHGSFSNRMVQAIDDALISMMRQVHESPHGAELIDMKGSLAADIGHRWREGLHRLIVAAIDKEARRTKADLDARGLSTSGLADMLLDGLEGMKCRLSAPEDQRTAAKSLVRLIEVALQA